MPSPTLSNHPKSGANHAPVLAVAPMMDCTDRFERYFLRLLSQRALLFTEMVTANAVVHGNQERLLAFHPSEHPVALQLGGSEPALMAIAARAGAALGYDEINMNVGCPSDRVQAGRFGACLMKEPNLVAACVSAMRDETDRPVTVKCRIGVDEVDSFGDLSRFVETVAAAGCKRFYLHARKAWLKGLSPKQNRELPPLRYDIARRLRETFPELEIHLNGGIDSLSAAAQLLEEFDGVMLGRAAYRNPYLLAYADRCIFGAASPAPSREEVVLAYLPFVREQLASGIRLTSITRHLVGLYQGQPGAKAWRRTLSTRAHRSGATETVLLEALEAVGRRQHAA